MIFLNFMIVFLIKLIHLNLINFQHKYSFFQYHTHKNLTYNFHTIIFFHYFQVLIFLLLLKNIRIFKVFLRFLLFINEQVKILFTFFLWMIILLII